MFGTRLIRLGYRWIAKPCFFRRDPEEVHDFVCRLGGALGRYDLLRRLTWGFLGCTSPKLEQKILGITFPNPVGLTAGFDKNAELTDIIPSVGFGFEEIGSVTGQPCEGNPKPRLWRLPKSKGLVVWYGLKNNGCVEIAKRLKGKWFSIPIGTNIARTNTPATVDVLAGIADYVKAFRAFSDIGSYTTVNISCPNTCGGEPFTNPEDLEQLLTALDVIPTRKPVFLKLPVDISTDELKALVDVAWRHRVEGFIVSNLTKDFHRPEIAQEEIRGIEKGGVSGRPVFDKSNALITELYKIVGKTHVIIGSGGIFTAEDAYKKICHGASLVQLATGMIFEGPQLIGEINRGLVALLEQDNLTHISQAIGKAV
jgi:dihydroorotate dehydrogenase